MSYGWLYQAPRESGHQHLRPTERYPMTLLSSPRLLTAVFMLCSLGSLAQSATKTTGSQGAKPRQAVSRVAAWQSEITIADTLRLATEYEPASPKKPAPDSLSEPAASMPSSPIYQPAAYGQSRSAGQQTVFRPVARRGNAPVSHPVPDKDESDLERVLNRKKQIN